MVRQASIVTIDDGSDEDMEIQVDKGRNRRSKSKSSSVIDITAPEQAMNSKRQSRRTVTVEEPSPRYILDRVELPSLTTREKAEYYHGRFLPAVPGQADLPMEDYVTKPAPTPAPRKSKWKTIADTTSEGEDELEMPLPKRVRNAKDYQDAGARIDNALDGDFVSIQSISSDEEEADIDLESEGNEWDKRPVTRLPRDAKKRRKVDPDVESIDSGSDDNPIGRRRPKPKGKETPTEISSDGDDFDEILDDSQEDHVDLELTKVHRSICHKCNLKPSHDMFRAMMQKRNKKGYRPKKTVDELLHDEESLIDKLGGWVECRRCCVSLHWNCLAFHTRNELLAEDKKLDFAARQMKSGRLRMDHNLEIQCSHCTAPVSKDCYVCRSDNVMGEKSGTNGVDLKGKGVDRGKTAATESDKDLLFRCVRCFRAAHYEHLPSLDDDKKHQSASVLAYQYQSGKPKEGWHCLDCRQLPHLIEYIIAWRYSPPEAKDDKFDENIPLQNQQLRREYLLKFTGWGFRHATWVSHDYVSQTAGGKLRYFLDHGSRLKISTETDLANGGDDPLDEEAAVLQVDADADQIDEDDERPLPKPDADRELPSAWKTPDRILDLWFLTGKAATKAKAKQNRVESPEPEPQGVRYDFVKPEQSTLIHIDDWERRNKQRMGPAQAEAYVSRIGLVYVKWQDLQYEASTEDTPIDPESPYYPAFLEAFRNYLYARTVKIPVLTAAEAKARDARKVDGYNRLMGVQPDCIVNGKLMGFQIDGLDWLMNKWYNLTSVILADDMGLGKTVQIAAFLGLLGSKAWNVYPALVVVPNSTLQNWMREFAKWVPHLRVVPVQGSKASREIIRKYEMFSAKGELKCHVVLATYEIATSQKDFSVLLNKVPRWECLVVDEASRLKSQSNLIVKKLTALQPVHKILLTGTPLNNTVRELLNLMYFLDPEEWNNLDELEKRYAEMTEELAKELREKIAPYMLRRRKEDVLDLPPKNEIIVPLTMRPLQRNVYKSILEKNADLMQALAQATVRGGAPLKMKAAHNILMQLRKCLQHPFLNTPELEDRTLGSKETHQALIDASGKLTFLKTLLPKLKAKGHRILLFSQFVIALNIIEDFCDGEGYRTLRLDGNTPQDQRQRDIDTFNAPDSDHFLYLISTRAGGMGINLATADTVIVHDLDFNPHQDMQAIARAYRYGQKNKVLVMRFMTTPTVEERMMQIAKKKLVLDHLIVQAKDSDSSDNIANILLDGARAILDGTDTDDKTYDDQAVEDLIVKLETGEEEKSKDDSGFTFAPVFDNKKGRLQALDTNDTAPPEDPDFWANVVKRANEERIKKEAEEHGRGKRKRGAAQANSTRIIEVDEKDQTTEKSKSHKKKRAEVDSEGSAYEFKDNEAESDAEIDAKEVAREMQEEMLPGPSGSPRKGLLKAPKQSAKPLEKVARPAHRRRLSAKGEEIRSRGNPQELAFYHIHRVYDLAQRWGLYSKDKLDRAMDDMTNPARSGAERKAEYAKVAAVIDNHLAIQGQPKICGSSKSIAEVQFFLEYASEPKKKKSPVKNNGAGSNPSIPTLPPAPTAPLCPSCRAEMIPHGVCFKCVAGIQTQMRTIAASTEDNEEDKAAALSQLEQMLDRIRTSAANP